jgi:hypothetical protein
LTIVKTLTFKAECIIRFFKHSSNYGRKILTLFSKIRLEKFGDLEYDKKINGDEVFSENVWLYNFLH